MFKPVILSIAGSDSSSRAGIQADNKTIIENGGYPVNVITAITSQNITGVQGVYLLPTKQIKLQAKAILEDYNVQAIKIGMVYNTRAIQAILKILTKYNVKHLVIDPVMRASSGYMLLKEKAMESLEELFKKATLITPNILEAEHFSNHTINSKNIVKYAEYLAKKYQTSVLLKGGHLQNTKMLTDVLYDYPNQNITQVRHPFINSQNAHGTGCKLSSAIATHLALKNSLEQAVQSAVKYLQEIL